MTDRATRLVQIYQILLPLAEASQSPPVLTSNQNEKPQSTLRTNRYASLTGVNLTEERDDSGVTMQREDTTEDTPSTKNTQQVLQDDELGEYSIPIPEELCTHLDGNKRGSAQLGFELVTY